MQRFLQPDVKEDGSYTTLMHYHNMTIAKQSGMSNPNDCSESKFDTHLVLSNISDTVSSQGDCTGNYNILASEEMIEVAPLCQLTLQDC